MLGLIAWQFKQMILDRLTSASINLPKGLLEAKFGDQPPKQTRALEAPAIGITTHPVLIADFVLKERAKVVTEVERAKKAGVKDIEEVLITEVAMLRITVKFERAHFLIWGTQLDFLMNLNLFDVSDASLAQWYAGQASRLPSERSLESWTAYLLGEDFVSNSGGNWSITLQGKEFLAYLLRQSYALAKPH